MRAIIILTLLTLILVLTGCQNVNEGSSNKAIDTDVALNSE